MKKSNSLIQIPYTLIANSKIKSKTTFLYLMMKLKSQQQKDNTFILNIYSDKFLNELGWTQKTMKKHIDIMHSMGIILDYQFNKHKPMIVHINKVKQKNKGSGEPYAQIDRKTINTILESTNNVEIKQKNKKTKQIEIINRNLNEQAIRLYYYYEKNYNKNEGYAFPSMNTIAEECKISKETITTLNKIFKKQHILYIEHGKKIHFNNEDSRPQKENNKYIPLCNGRIY